MIDILFSAIYKYYKANSEHDFVKITEGRFWPEDIAGDYPEVDKYPSATYTSVSFVDGGLIEGRYDSIIFQISCYGKSVAEAVTMGRQCRDLFDKSIISAEDCSMYVNFDTAVGPMREANDEPFLVAITFQTILG